MDKIMFLATLAEKLSHYPLTDAQIEKQINNMQRYLASIGDAELEQEAPTEEEAEEIAESIYNKYYANKKEEPVAKETAPAEEAEEATEEVVPAEATEEAVADEPAEEIPEEATEEPVEELGEEELEAIIPPVEENLDEEAFVEAPVEEIPEESAEEVPIEENLNEEDYIEELAKEAEDERRYEELKQVAIERAKQDGVLVDVEEAPEEVFDAFEEDVDFEAEEPKKKEREPVKGSPLFWILAILTCPITLPLIAVFCVILGVLYVVVTTLIIAFSALLLAIVAGGTAVSLIGIIYGATQTVKSVPVGLFEVGCGIVVGGVTLLISILVYNLTLRVIPKLFKAVTALAKSVFGKLSDLFYNLKKGSAK